MRRVKLIKFLLLAIISLFSGCYFGYHPPTKLDILSDVDYKWQHDSTAHFDFYYELNSASTDYADSAKLFYEKMLPALLDYLGIESYDNRLTLIMVESRQRMKKMVGLEANGVAEVEDNTVYSVFNNDIKTFGKHEFCHVICYNLWGNYREVWLSEGLAVASDNVWWGYELHSLSNYLRIKNKLIPIRKIIEKFQNYDSFVAYPESGSFVKFIRDKYGLSVIQKLWTDGIKVLEDSLNTSVESLEEEWLNVLNKHEQRDIKYEENIFAMYGKKL